MKNIFRTVCVSSLATISMGLAGCGGPAGDPELVTLMEGLANTVCECKDKQCVNTMKFNGEGVTAPLYMGKRKKNLTESEKKSWTSAKQKFDGCYSKFYPGY